MNVDKKTQIGETKKNKRNIPLEPVSELRDSLHEIQTYLQNLWRHVRNKFYFVITSTAEFIPGFKSN